MPTPKPHEPPPPPKPHPEPPPRPARHDAERNAEPPLPIGAKPADPKDPQAIKFDPPPAPPRYDTERTDRTAPPAWTPEPAIDPRAEHPPAGVYADGMDIATEQRARAAWVEAHGLAKYHEEVDQRPSDERPKIDPHALAGGAAIVSPSPNKQVPGVTPPTKRE
jgi:hypothetical protein